MIAFIIIMIFATVFTFFWLILLNTASREEWISAAYNKTLENLDSISKLRQKSESNKKKLEMYRGFALSVMKIFIRVDHKKEIAGLERQNERLKKGSMKYIGIFIIPGYTLQKKINDLNKSGIHKKIFNLYSEIYGRKYAEARTKGLFAKIFSYSIIGVPISLTLGAWVIILIDFINGIAISGIGTAIIFALIYSMYDSLRVQAKKRRENISKQFPNVVSKLALLVTSGMIMDKAWKETAYSQELELYKEMQKTSEELDNLVSPEVAYGGFIKRCGTKETAKLASAVIQNLSKNNSEIGFLLKTMAKEAWSERRHTAKRDAEKANSKLLIPTMLLFLAILIMIMVPVAMNFSGGLF